jgi:hypothetical protein
MQMSNAHIWQQAEAVWAATAPHYQPVLSEFCEHSGLDDWTTGLLIASLSLEPQPVSPNVLRVRTPYTAAGAYAQKLAVAKEAGYLEEISPGQYYLSEKGCQDVPALLAEVRRAMSCVDPLPATDSHRLSGFLSRLVQASVDTRPPPDTWSIRLSIKLLPDPQPPLPYIEQLLTCLNAYRDDAHLAAWLSRGLYATALEVLTLIWRGEANSLETLFSRLEKRGHTLQVYADAIEMLRARGLLCAQEGLLALTTQGVDTREQIEADTDRFFFTPWSCLTRHEKDELVDLLVCLEDGLKARMS